MPRRSSEVRPNHIGEQITIIGANSAGSSGQTLLRYELSGVHQNHEQLRIRTNETSLKRRLTERRNSNLHRTRGLSCRTGDPRLSEAIELPKNSSPLGSDLRCSGQQQNQYPKLLNKKRSFLWSIRDFLPPSSVRRIDKMDLPSTTSLAYFVRDG